MIEVEHFTDKELEGLLATAKYDEELRRRALALRRKIYGDKIFVRSLIEFTNFCQNDCYYCGIRCGNKKAERYRLTQREILDCCEKGYALGFRTFVLQGGEDAFFSDAVLVPIVQEIKKKFSDVAITLSVGERSKESYQKLFEAGAERYLLRHETADENHFAKLHPEQQKLSTRLECLKNLKEIGYVVGSGFMVGSPFQTLKNLVQDIRFLQNLQPEMIGIGPFISHKDTIFKNEPNGDLQLTLRLLAILRILFPYALLPATTALGTLAENGRELGMEYGANVLMPNLSPQDIRKKYNLYDNKIYDGDEDALQLANLQKRMAKAGWEIVIDRGDPARRA